MYSFRVEVLVKPEVDVSQIAEIDAVANFLPDVCWEVPHELSIVAESQEVENAVDVGAGGEVEAGSHVPPLFVVVVLAFVLPKLLLLGTLLALPEHQVAVDLPAQRLNDVASCLKFVLILDAVFVGHDEVG